MSSETITRNDLTNILNEILPSQGADYVVEQGTSGIWTYRKWNSGIAECWGLYTTGSVAISRAFGNIYTHQNQIDGVAYPFTFTSAPYEVETIHNANCWIMYQNAQTTTTSKSFWIVRPVSYATSAQYAVDIYVKGTWK